MMAAVASANDEKGVRDFIARWNAAYTGLDATTLATLETPDFQFVDLFGHWIKSEGPEFNRRLWAMSFDEIYQRKTRAGPQCREHPVYGASRRDRSGTRNHWDGVTLDDGTHILPFWEINTCTLIKTNAGWRLALLNIHNQINPGTEGVGQRVPKVSTK